MTPEAALSYRVAVVKNRVVAERTLNFLKGSLFKDGLDYSAIVLKVRLILGVVTFLVVGSL